MEIDHENDIYRTFRTNAIFDVIRSFSERNGNKKTGNFQNELKKSGLVQRLSKSSNSLIEDVWLINSKLHI